MLETLLALVVQWGAASVICLPALEFKEVVQEYNSVYITTTGNPDVLFGVVESEREFAAYLESDGTTCIIAVGKKKNI